MRSIGTAIFSASGSSEYAVAHFHDPGRKDNAKVALTISYGERFSRPVDCGFESQTLRMSE
jgi:hypothetical protein